jgi:hypothetical protein
MCSMKCLLLELVPLAACAQTCSAPPGTGQVPLYSKAVALLGSDTPRAIALFQQALSDNAKFPWPWRQLMDIYATPNFKNPAKLAEAMLQFTELCPHNLDGYALLNLVEDPTALRELAAHLRKEVDTVSIAIDDNPGLVGPFLRDNGYTSPVLLAKAAVDELMPEVSVPRNWIADTAGTLRLELIGFDSRIADWPRRMLEKLAQPLP